jgi:hypothetical protein
MVAISGREVGGKGADKKLLSYRQKIKIIELQDSKEL